MISSLSSSSSSISASPAPTHFGAVLRHLWRADFLSAKDLVKRALVIALFFGLAHGAGLKEFTSVLSNTAGSVDAGYWLSAFLGLSYICLYLAFVLLVPIFLLAAAMLSAWSRSR